MASARRNKDQMGQEVGEVVLESIQYASVQKGSEQQYDNAVDNAGEPIPVCEIRRHPFGIIALYLQYFVVIMVSLLLFLFLAPSVSEDISGNMMTVIAGITALAVAIIVLLLLIATYVYRESRLKVTSKNLTQVMQIGLFNRKTSKLSMASVEDVTASQKGIFATIFNFGTLTIETAGEQQNFIFPFCPNPNHYAREILAARERFIQQDAERSYRITPPRRKSVLSIWRRRVELSVLKFIQTDCAVSYLPLARRSFCYRQVFLSYL